MTDVREKVTAIIIDLWGVEQSQITDDAGLVENLGADSLDIVELTMELEEAFKIEIPDNYSDNWQNGTFGDVVAYIAQATA